MRSSPCSARSPRSTSRSSSSSADRCAPAALGIVGAADIVVAAESVTFALTEVRLGLAPAVISLSLLPSASRRARRRTCSSPAARSTPPRPRGWASSPEPCPTTSWRPASQGVLDDLVKGYPQGLRETKALLNHDLVARIDALGEDMSTLSARLFGSDEAREAMLAFLESRKK